jgi:NIMA (never in mitosis gene a)-related kinase
MDFANDGDLYQKIVKNKKDKSYFNEDYVWKVLIGTLQALAQFHDMKIFHRDIKSANIFLNKNGTAILGDLNVSKVAKQGLLYTQTGTPYYASPEVWKDLPYDTKSDIWSLGCVFYEVLSLHPPFRAKDMNGLFKKVTLGVFDDPPKHFSPEMRNLVTSMIRVNPKDRPSSDQILRMPEVQIKMKQLKLINTNKDIKEERRPSLLQTIKLPKNLKNLDSRLPKSNYETDQPD